MAKAENEKPNAPNPCNCAADPFAELPPELRPQPVKAMKGLRKVTCPGCGTEFWTNRPTDLCIDCERKGVRLPTSPSSSGG